MIEETNMQKAVKWIKTSGIAAVGGGIAGIVSALMDPEKYQFPRDLGSGRMWKWFFMGMALTFGGLLLKSPLGQRAMTAYKQSQADLAQSQADLTKAKEELKSSAPAAENKKV